uniref:type II inositol 3,4-bisphosphate 4-phosphatase-like isoform X1 n=1 Tax=Halichoerus grypus TaxID=9711 RepID=UPI001659E2AD|nr:type II inositol 3,4-bisphosphate 4-phosphatase-like isoform X1 [Halichoerus grypus]
MEIKEEGASEEGQHFLPTPQANDAGDFQFTSIQKTPNEPQLEFILACKDLVAPVRDRKLNTLVQISVIHPAEQGLTRYSSTEIVEGTRDPLFLTGVTFPSEYPIYEETKIKLTVYDVKDKSHDTVSTCTYFSFLGGGKELCFSKPLGLDITGIFQRGCLYCVYACLMFIVC